MYSTGSSVRRMPVSRAAATSARDITRVGISAAIAVVVQVVEFADGGVAGFEHLGVQLRGDGLPVSGSKRAAKRYIVSRQVRTIVGVGLALGHAAIARWNASRCGLAMPARSARSRWAGSLDRRDAAVVVDGQAGIGAPAGRGPQHRRVEGLHGGILACPVRAMRPSPPRCRRARRRGGPA
jgi:hypothetical protein